MQRQSIAVGIVFNQYQQVLISKRGVDKHLANFWEFPGGKVEKDESFKFALRRELCEELGINITKTIKILEYQHSYEDRLLDFQFYKVIAYDGNVQSKEGQQIRWINVKELSSVNLPAANKGVISALSLPNLYMIADEKFFRTNLISCVEQQLINGIKVIQHRASADSSKSIFIQNALQIKLLCEKYQAKYVANCNLEWIGDIEPHCIHLTSENLKIISSKNLNAGQHEYFSASCHNQEEVELANKLEVKCILIGPVNVTKSHSGMAAIGWKRFSELCHHSNAPVYALGGLELNDYKTAPIYGAQGIAAIRAFS